MVKLNKRITWKANFGSLIWITGISLPAVVHPTILLQRVSSTHV